MANVNNAQQIIDDSQLTNMVAQQGFEHRLQQRSNNSEHTTTLMEGSFFFDNLPSGISIHGTEATETRDIFSSTELPASLSFNILLAGSVNFIVNHTEYYFSATQHHSACFVSVLSKNELFTRRLVSGEFIRKVNIFIKREWLEKHCITKEDKTLVETLFRHHALLCQWLDSGKFTEIAQQLLLVATNAEKSNALTTTLQKEQIAYALLTELLKTLPEQLKKNSLTGKPIANTSKKRQLKSMKIARYLVEQELPITVDVNKIAKTFGLSVSTLQRHFKEAFNMTVSEYVRVKHLERAKVAISLQNTTIGEAAFHAGYNHVSNFTAAFKKQFNITPASLLKVHQID